VHGTGEALRSEEVQDGTDLAVPVDEVRGTARPLLYSDRFWGWAAPIVIMIFGGLLRFWRLGDPHRLIFDETYYVKEAESFLRYGVEVGFKASLSSDPNKRNEAADKLFNAGNLDIRGPDPEFVVHPPVGKWMIAAGEWLLGPTNSWGWRLAAAVVGTLSILMIGRIARRMFRSTLLGGVAALLLAVDTQELVHSRVSILDIFVMFWALAAFGCLLVDRDQNRQRLRDRIGTADPPGEGRGRGLGPWTGVRWWRIAAIVCLALCTGVKWSGLYFAAVFLLMSVLWDCSARRAAGVRHWFAGGVLRDGAQAFVTAAVLMPVIYVSTWAGWLHSDRGYGRQWADQNPAQGIWTHVPNALRSLLHYHQDMWTSANSITSKHDWQANPWAWMVLGRPTLMWNDVTHAGQPGCSAPTCNQMITDLGNPAIWWPGVIALGVLLFMWALGRDWRAGAALSGLVAGYLPWFQYQHRTIFEFYAVAFVPWVVLGVTYCVGLVLGRPGADEERRRHGALLAGGYVLIAVLVGWIFYPITAGQVIPGGELDLRHWLPSWF
jgi:dolichyl-phosphate-mannose--protein O-mannosyl transferase